MFPFFSNDWLVFAEENVQAYFMLTSGWCKALILITSVVTCCCCCCCFFCCCNWCCGKYKPKHPEEDFTNLREDLDGDEGEGGGVHTSQPQASNISAAGAPAGDDPWSSGQVPIAMGSGQVNEKTGLTSAGPQSTYNPYPSWE